MPRDGQSAAYDLINDAEGADSRDLFDVTLRTGVTVYVSNASITPGGQVTQSYEPDARATGDLRYSEGDNVDNLSLTFQNADGLFGMVDEFGVSPLDGASVVYRKAVASPDENDWEVDTIGHFILRDIAKVDDLSVPFSLVPDYADPSRQMSAETIFLEELTPVAAEVAGGDAGDSGSRGRPDFQNRSGGFLGNFFDYLRHNQMDRDFNPLLD